MEPSVYNSYQQQNKGRRIVFVLALCVGVAIVVVTTLILISSRQPAGSVHIELQVLPEGATVRVDGREPRGRVFLQPGEYPVEASYKGFKTQKSTLTVGESTDKQHLAISLLPVSDDAKQYVKEHPELYEEIEHFGGQQALEQGAILYAQNPITKDLPIKQLVYSVGYINDLADSSGKSIIITVNAPQGYRNSAIKKIESLGYNVAEYKYQFKDYVNPFEDKDE